MNPEAQLIFCNGGDRNITNIPESVVASIEFAFGVGGENKKNSSSSILYAWHTNTEERSWGNFSTLITKPNIKFKELKVKPNQGMSFQRHLHRSEVWFVFQGACKVLLQLKEDKEVQLVVLGPGDLFETPVLAKHQIIHDGDNDCLIIEIQYGDIVMKKILNIFFATLRLLKSLQYPTPIRLDGRVVMQRPAKP